MTNITKTWSARAVTISIAANSRRPPASTEFRRPVRSASTPPRGTETATSHRATPVTELAAVLLQPRSTSMAGPKLKTMLSAAL